MEPVLKYVEIILYILMEHVNKIVDKVNNGRDIIVYADLITKE
jgi:hypothetical protein